MAGIGEASAIIAVSQLGISLSTALIGYVGEVKDAGPHIQRVADEISSTCDRLKELGDLVEQNPTTCLFSQEGLRKSERLASSCQSVIDEIRQALKKADVEVNSKSFSSDELDISRFSKLYWPFIRNKLELPRTELSRLKIDLLLLYDSVKFAGAKTRDEQMEYAESIPRLEQSRKWAAHQYEEAVRRSTSQRPHRNKRDDDESERADFYEVDEENMFEFLTFKEQRLAEEREARLQMQLELKRLEEREKAGIEAVKRRLIEEEAILKWKEAQEVERRKEEEERLKRNMLVEEKLRQELERLKLPEEQIEKAIHAATEESSNVARDSVGSSSVISGFKTKNGLSGSKFWSLLRVHPSKASSNPSNSSVFPQRVPWDPVVFEAWSLDQSSNSQTRIPLPDAWLANQVAQQARIGQAASIWKNFALLHPTYKSQIHRLINEKDAIDARYQWTLASLETMYRKRRSGILTRVEEQVSVQIVLERLSQEPSSSAVSRAYVASLSQPSIKDSPTVSSKLAPEAPNENTRADYQQRSTAVSGHENSHDRSIGGVFTLDKDKDVSLPSSLPHLDSTSPTHWGWSGSQEHGNLSQQTSSGRRRQVHFDLPERTRFPFNQREPSYGPGKREDWSGPYDSGPPIILEERSYHGHPIYFPAAEELEIRRDTGLYQGPVQLPVQRPDRLHGYHQPYSAYPPSRRFSVDQLTPLSQPRRVSPPPSRRNASRDRWRDKTGSTVVRPQSSRQRLYTIVANEDDALWDRADLPSGGVTSDDSSTESESYHNISGQTYGKPSIARNSIPGRFTEASAHVRLPPGSGPSWEEDIRKAKEAREREQELLRRDDGKSAGAPHTESKDEVLNKYLKMYTSIKNVHLRDNTTNPRPAPSSSTSAPEPAPTEPRLREELRSSQIDLCPIVTSSTADDAVGLARSIKKDDDEESV